MADYGDQSGGYSDQAIRDIVAQLVSNGQPAAPLNLAPAAPVTKPKEDDWAPPAPTMTPPPVQFAPMGAIAARPQAPQLAPPPQASPTWADMLQQRSPRSQPNIGAIREINPGVLWGGQDRNVMLPEDVQASRTYGHGIEPL